MKNISNAHNILLWKNKIWESKVSNTGDLAIILNTILKLKERFPKVNIHMVSDDPEYVEKQYGICSYPIKQIFNPFKLYRILKKMDLVILGGGTILQDNYFIGIIPINLSIGLLAKMMGVKVICNAIGVAADNEITSFGKFLCRFSLKKFDSITVRDIESKELLEKWTKGKVAPVYTADMAVDIEPVDFNIIESTLKEEGIDLRKNNTVAIAVRKIFHHEKTCLNFIPSSVRTKLGFVHRLFKTRFEDFKSSTVLFCDYLNEQYGLDVVLIPFYSSGGSVNTENIQTPERLFSSGDNKLAEEIQSKVNNKQKVHILRKTYKPEEIISIMGQCEAMIGVPYHSVVLASSRNVPVIGINYVSKVKRYMKILGQENYNIPVNIQDGFSLGILKEKFDMLWQNRVDISEKLKTKNSDLHKLCDINIERIAQCLEKQD